MSQPKNSKDALEFIHTLDSLAIKKQKEEIERLKSEVERLTRKLEVADNHAQCLEMVINAGTANELRLKAEVEQLSAFCTRTIIPNGILQAEVNQLKIELADAQESYHIINEIIASERNVHRMNTAMLKDQIDGLQLDNRLLGERVLAYQRLKKLNDISRPPNKA